MDVGLEGRFIANHNKCVRLDSVDIRFGNYLNCLSYFWELFELSVFWWWDKFAFFVKKCIIAYYANDVMPIESLLN